MRSFNGNIGLINKYTSSILNNWLFKNDIPYDEFMNVIRQDLQLDLMTIHVGDLEALLYKIDAGEDGELDGGIAIDSFIDLLKIDIEGCEELALNGIEKSDWKKIRQIHMCFSVESGAGDLFRRRVAKVTCTKYRACAQKLSAVFRKFPVSDQGPYYQHRQNPYR